MQVVILCGGLGTRLREETEYQPKPMLTSGGRPILWHIMKGYSHHGFNEFVLCLGYKGEQIKEYFYNYEILTNDFTIELGGKQRVQVHDEHPEKDWRVTLADTGEDAMTGARVKRIARYTGDHRFMMTYGDGLSDIDIRELLRFHQAHGKIGTVTGVLPSTPFGRLSIEGERVTSFIEKPQSKGSYVSGGFFVFEPAVFDYLDDTNSCVLEREPLERLAADGELMTYLHEGHWDCMDTYRDFKHLNEVWAMGNAPWCVWDKPEL